MGKLSLEEFRATRIDCIVWSEWIMEIVGSDAEPRDMDIFMYDEGYWIERVPNSSYFTICGNADLAEAEEFLYNQWYKED